MTVTVNVSIVKNKKLKSLRGLYMHIPLEMQMRSKMGTQYRHIMYAEVK